MKGDVCKVDGCTNIIISKHGKACGSCRAKKRRYGSYAGAFSPKTIEDKFWPNVLRTDTCHLWTAYVEPAGYGKLRVGNTNQRTHRIAWQLHTGMPVPDNLLVLHKCDVRNCVNPEHLFLGDHEDNVRDMDEKGRRAKSSLRGEQCSSAKLKEKDVVKIKRLLAEGQSLASIARRYNVTPTPIFKIKNKQSWSHIE